MPVYPYLRTVERTIADILIEFSKDGDPADLLIGHIITTTDAKLFMVNLGPGANRS